MNIQPNEHLNEICSKQSVEEHITQLKEEFNKMSFGEKTCKMYGNCNNDPTPETCNTLCEFYNPKDEENGEIVVPDNKPRLVRSTEEINPKFNKEDEMIVLKNHIFYIQSISPKKVILKFQRKLDPSDNLVDGIFCFLDKDDEALPLKTTMKMALKRAAENNAKRKADKEAEQKETKEAGNLAAKEPVKE